ncbi:hypothetical protein [Acinetobacter johnsonii]|uniref:hypothetical protein n=1 Tax=Acinetobacter TaxID=469 RepID=UPI003F56B0D2
MIKIFGDIKKLVLLGTFILLNTIIFVKEANAQKLKCDLKSNDNNKIYEQVVVIPDDTNGRFYVIQNSRRVLAQSYSDNGIRWGAGVELSHATLEALNGDGDSLQKIRENGRPDDDGIYWELEGLNLKEIKSGDDRDAWGDMLLKYGKCKNAD